jgi:hypothetical protein
MYRLTQHHIQAAGYEDEYFQTLGRAENPVMCNRERRSQVPPCKKSDALTIFTIWIRGWFLCPHFVF